MEAVISIESYPCKKGMDFESNGAASILNCAVAQASAQDLLEGCGVKFL
jgi:hypothetical protein